MDRIVSYLQVLPVELSYNHDSQEMALRCLIKRELPIAKQSCRLIVAVMLRFLTAHPAPLCRCHHGAFLLSITIWSHFRTTTSIWHRAVCRCYLLKSVITRVPNRTTFELEHSELFLLQISLDKHLWPFHFHSAAASPSHEQQAWYLSI